jgi:hypothetical protein
MVSRVVRRFVDATGRNRELKKLGAGFFVEWSREVPECTSTRWLAEDGSTLQIPDNAWEFYGITFTDEELE